MVDSCSFGSASTIQCWQCSFLVKKVKVSSYIVDLIRASSRVFGGLDRSDQLIFWERLIRTYFGGVVHMYSFQFFLLFQYFCCHCTVLHWLQWRLLLWVFTFQLSYSVSGLIYRCFAVERPGKFFPVSFLVLLARLLNYARFFSTRWGVARNWLSWLRCGIFLFCLLVFVIDCSARTWGSVFFCFNHWYSWFCRSSDFFL